ncbi:ubiquitin family protein [Nocardioides pakistanensis]
MTSLPEPHPNSIPLLRTADGVEIVDGLAVWDYDLGRGTVRLPRDGYNGVDSPTWDGWFDVVGDDGARTLMNGERVVTRHPVTREPAAR